MEHKIGIQAGYVRLRTLLYGILSFKYMINLDYEVNMVDLADSSGDLWNHDNKLQQGIW